MKNNEGFTLIELVVIIAITGILAAIAIPKFINLSKSAQMAATSSIAVELTNANASNYTARKVNKKLGFAISNCIDVANALQGGLPKRYEISPAKVATETKVACTLKGPGGVAVPFEATGIL